MSGKSMPSHHGVEVFPSGEYTNETMKLLYERGSCRDFSNRKVPRDVLDAILGAGTHAPTGGNLQPYSVIKVEEDERRQRLSKMCGQKFVGDAPVHLIFCIDWHRIGRWAELETAPFTAPSSFRHFWISFQDTIICAQNICTAADAMGLGSVYIGSVLELFEELRDMLELPDHVFPVVLLCLGYPSKRTPSRKKLNIDVVVHDEKYHELRDDELLRAFEEKYTGPDSRRIEITENRLKTIHSVCTKVHGKEFADRCVEKIGEKGYISSIQRYFGLHYRADRMPEHNQKYLEIMEKFGFRWFKEFQPEKK